MTRETLIRYWRGLVGWIQSLDTGGLKRLAVFTYFGVYAFLFVAHRLVNQLVFALPARVRPPPVVPVWEVLAYPQSVAMALFSFGITVLVVGTVVTRDALGRLEASPSIRGRLPSLPSPPSPWALLPGRSRSTGDGPVSTDGSGESQREPEGGTGVEGRPGGPAGQLDLADAESKVDDDEWPGEWVSGDDL